MNHRERQELDRHITGNYGEDQMADEVEYEVLLQQRDELLAAAKLLLAQYDSSGDFTMGGNLTNKPFLMFRAALEKMEGR